MTFEQWMKQASIYVTDVSVKSLMNVAFNAGADSVRAQNAARCVSITLIWWRGIFASDASGNMTASVHNAVTAYWQSRRQRHGDDIRRIP